MRGLSSKAYVARNVILSLLTAAFLWPVLLFPLSVYAASDSITTSLRIEQIFTKNSTAASVNSSCSYTLTALDSANPMPAGTANGTYAFALSGTTVDTVASLTFVNTGIYSYQVKASSLSKNGYSYDKEIYTVTFYVSRPANDLKAELVIQKGSDKKVNGIRFENSYTPLPSDLKLMSFPVVKLTVSGSPASSTTFTFLLTAKDKDYPMPEGSVNGVKTIMISGSGEKDLGTWQYTKEGTYYYTVSQVDGKAAGYTYDMSLYTIIDVVKDVGGQLVLTRTVTNEAGKQVQVCAYINKYSGNNSSSNGGNQGGGVSGPKTGDDSQWNLYLFLLGFSAFIAVVCLFYLIAIRKKNRERQQVA